MMQETVSCNCNVIACLKNPHTIIIIFVRTGIKLFVQKPHCLYNFPLKDRGKKCYQIRADYIIHITCMPLLGIIVYHGKCILICVIDGIIYLYGLLVACSIGHRANDVFILIQQIIQPMVCHNHIRIEKADMCDFRIRQKVLNDNIVAAAESEVLAGIIEFDYCSLMG